MLFTLTPRQLAYISISLAVIVIIATLCMIIFPDAMNKSDKYFAFE
jgi:hypothetical protein